MNLIKGHVASYEHNQLYLWSGSNATPDIGDAIPATHLQSTLVSPTLGMEWVFKKKNLLYIRQDGFI